jgi:hypothetical protein
MLLLDKVLVWIPRVSVLRAPQQLTSKLHAPAADVDVEELRKVFPYGEATFEARACSGLNLQAVHRLCMPVLAEDFAAGRHNGCNVAPALALGRTDMYSRSCARMLHMAMQVVEGGLACSGGVVIPDLGAECAHHAAYLTMCCSMTDAVSVFS